MTKLTRALLIATCMTSAATHAASFNTIPKESGFDGFVLVGGTFTNFSSNIVAGNSLTHVDHESTNGLNEDPSSENGVSGVLTGELNYTFADQGLQIYVGNELEDVLRYDLATKFGVRKDLNGNGIARVAYITSGVLPTHVYEDPFNVESTTEADRDMQGVQFGLDDIFKSGVNIEFSLKDVDVEDEKSGQSLVESNLIEADEQNLLKRTGVTRTAKVSYSHSFSSAHHIEPEFVVERADKDGSAIAHDRYGASLSYLYLKGRFSLVGQLAYSHSEYDEISPIWGMDEVGDNNISAASLVVSYAKPFGWEDTSFVTSLAYANENSNIDFYDAHIATASMGMLYQF